MNTTIPTEANEFDAKELGAMLSEIRQNLGYEIEKVAKDLRIRSTYLEAIESGRLTELPGNTYVTGFLRVYSDYLGLDGQDVVRRFKMADMEITNRPELHLPSPVEDGRLPTSLILGIGIIIAVCAYTGWDYLSSPGGGLVQIETQSPNVLSSRSHSVIDERVSGPRQVQGSSPLRTTTLVGGTLEKTAPETAPVKGRVGPQKSQIAVQSEPELEGLKPKPEMPNSSASVQKAGRPAPVEITPGAASGRALIVVRATDYSYVAIKKQNGDSGSLFAKLMQPGERYEVPLEANLILETGNAGGLLITIGDKTAPTLGNLGEVIRNIPLNAKWLLGARD